MGRHVLQAGILHPSCCLDFSLQPAAKAATDRSTSSHPSPSTKHGGAGDRSRAFLRQAGSKVSSVAQQILPGPAAFCHPVPPRPRLLGDASSYSYPEWRRKHSKHPAVVGILKDNQFQGSPACSACPEPRVTGPTSQHHTHPGVPAQMTHPADLTAPTPLLAPRSQGSSPKPAHAMPGYPPHVPSSGLTLCPEGVASLRVKGHSRATLLYCLSGGVSPHSCLLSSGAEARC